MTLARHNLYRTKHQAQPLAWSTRLQKEAQDWADNCWWVGGAGGGRGGRAGDWDGDVRCS